MSTSNYTNPVRIGIAALILAALPTLQAESSPSWTTQAGLTLKETHDDNVYLQNVTALAERESWVSSAALNLGATFQATPNVKFVLSYAPEVFAFHSESKENHTDHRIAANVGGKGGDIVWDVQNSLLSINGDDEGPNFLPGGDIPALGGIPLRDRRDAQIYRHSTRITFTQGSWFIRPQLSAYVHDFQTQQHARTGLYAGYENYVDRSEISAGIDVGYKGFGSAALVGGYRYGQQRQEELLGVSSPYSNRYHRILIGIEGTVAPWLKASVLAGPDLRDFHANPPPAFNRDEVIYHVDGVLTFIPTTADTVTLTLRRFEQPAFSSHSMYEDIVYDLSWRRKCSSGLTVTLGWRAYEGDWQGPVNRLDWIYTGTATVAYAWSANLAGEITFARDSASSKVPSTSARNYARNLLSAGLKYTF